MNAVKIGLQVLLVVSNLFLILLILLHKGKGGGLSDMFGGGVSSSPRWFDGRRAQPRPLHHRPGHHLVRHHRRPRAARPVPGLTSRPGRTDTTTGRRDGPATTPSTQRLENRGRTEGTEPWPVVTRFAAAGSAPGRWARPSAATPHLASTSPSGAPTGTRPGRASPTTASPSRRPGTARAAAPGRSGPGQPAGPAEDRALQDPPRVRARAAHRRRRRGDPRRGAQHPARARPHPVAGPPQGIRLRRPAGLRRPRRAASGSPRSRGPRLRGRPSGRRPRRGRRSRRRPCRRPRRGPTPRGCGRGTRR